MCYIKKASLNSETNQLESLQLMTSLFWHVVNEANVLPLLDVNCMSVLCNYNSNGEHGRSQPLAQVGVAV